MNKNERNNMVKQFAHFGEDCKNVVNEMARKMIFSIKEYQKQKNDMNKK